jgi:hypothetical protein
MNPNGTKYQPPPSRVLDKRIQSFDKPGEHLWTMMASWHISDARVAAAHMRGADPENPILMDTENLIGFVGPGCFKCEQPYSNRVARGPCRGSVTKTQ